MAILGFEIEEISRVLALMDAGNLEEIEWEETDRYLKASAIRLNAVALPPPTAPVPAPPKPKSRTQTRAQKKSSSSEVAEQAVAGQVALISPMVGIFYRSGKPGDPPFVEIGQRISKDQIIGIIEAMKIFSEVPAEHDGVIVAIPARDGQLVQAGAPLLILRQDA